MKTSFAEMEFRIMKLDQEGCIAVRSTRQTSVSFQGRSETDVDKADLETVIGDLMSGQYSDSVRVFAFDTGEHWPEDASEDVAREIMRRLDLAGDALPSSIAAFVDRHLGPDCQLTLRLA
jgi:hypothetical protein